MTLAQEGKIGGRRFAVLREKGTTTGYQCLECDKETKPDPDKFRRHECKAAAPEKAKGTSSSTTKGKDGDA